MDWSNLGLIFVAGSQLTLAFIILFINFKNKICLYFSAAVFCLAAWTAFTALFRMVSGVEAIRILYSFKISFGLLIALFFEIFAIYFPYQRWEINKLVQAIVMIPTLLTILIILTFPQFLLTNIFVNPGANTVTVNKIFWILFSFSFTLSFVAVFVRLIIKFKEIGGFMKKSLLFVIVGGLVPVILSWFFNIIFLFFDVFVFDWIGALLSLIFCFVMYYFIFFKMD
ncbi:MAG: hypothetical protein JW816_02335 [Candidatus Buchananbacteria bacterium]|nr:hypothetical protein [Candidatus Buchananbacteria bacterium]